MRYAFTLIILLILLAGCTGGSKQGEKLELTAPFVGGTTGLSADFVDLRAFVYDGGGDPFDIVVKIENLGETTVPASKSRVKLTGINPKEFGRTEDLSKSPIDDLIAVRKDPQGNVLPGSPVFVEFTGLNHLTTITGAQVSFPLRAEICSVYSTRAVSKLCFRSNILAPEAGGICEINEDKPIFNSGAPVQVGAVKEIAGAKDKVRFSFELSNAGTGQIFERGTMCDRSSRAKENKAYVIVTTNMPGLQCTGLTTTGTKAEGFTTLFENKKMVTCTQTATPPGDYEQQIDIEAVYDYEQYKQTTLTVKSSGDQPTTPAGESPLTS